MIKLLYFFKNSGKQEMVLGDSNRNGMPATNTKFIYSAETVYSFENGKFKECLKHRYGNKDLITLQFQDCTLEDIVNRNVLCYVGFFVGREIWNIGRFTTPYTVMSSLSDYYDTLHKTITLSNMSTKI